MYKKNSVKNKWYSLLVVERISLPFDERVTYHCEISLLYILHDSSNTLVTSKINMLEYAKLFYTFQGET